MIGAEIVSTFAGRHEEVSRARSRIARLLLGRRASGIGELARCRVHVGASVLVVRSNELNPLSCAGPRQISLSVLRVGSHRGAPGTTSVRRHTRRRIELGQEPGAIVERERRDRSEHFIDDVDEPVVMK